jgi:hypothetical protein
VWCFAVLTFMLLRAVLCSAVAVLCSADAVLCGRIALCQCCSAVPVHLHCCAVLVLLMHCCAVHSTGAGHSAVRLLRSADTVFITMLC